MLKKIIDRLTAELKKRYYWGGVEKNVERCGKYPQSLVR